MKTETRILAESISKFYGKSLIWVNAQAMNFVLMGLVANREEALEYMQGLCSSK